MNIIQYDVIKMRSPEEDKNLPEHVRRRMMGMKAEYEFLNLLESKGFATWHLRNGGDLLAKSSQGTYGV